MIYFCKAFYQKVPSISANCCALFLTLPAASIRRSAAVVEPFVSKVITNDSGSWLTEIVSMPHTSSHNLHIEHSITSTTLTLLSLNFRIFRGHTSMHLPHPSQSPIVRTGIFLYPLAMPACHLACCLPVPRRAIASTTTLCFSLSSTMGIVASEGRTSGSVDTMSPEYTTLGPSALRVSATWHRGQTWPLQLHSLGKLNLLVSAFQGMSPSLKASCSSNSTEVLS